jgi:hypothetical protein
MTNFVFIVYVPNSKISSLRVYANELKVSSDGHQACQLPSEVEGGLSKTECINGVVSKTGTTYYFDKFGGNNKRCIRANGSTRTNGSFSDVGTVEDCADKCVGRKGAAWGSILGFNYECEAKTCQW